MAPVAFSKGMIYIGGADIFREMDQATDGWKKGGRKETEEQQDQKQIKQVSKHQYK